ncbi:hypothetical protein BH23BAC1_BH23BAC1_43760 [soil metagenome]
MANKNNLKEYVLNPQLTEDEKITQINQELNYLLKHFGEKADKSKKSFHFYKYSSIVLAAITTIFSSWQVIYGPGFPLWILPVVSAFSTVMVAFLGISSAQRIWINSRTTRQHFQREWFLFNQQTDQYHNLEKEERIRLFSERMIQIWNEGHGKWEQTVNEG